MNPEENEEILANMHRADESLDAAEELIKNGHYDFSASRSYYAVFYATNSLLLSQNISRSKHSGAIAALHQFFIKPGKLSQWCGTTINELFELRGTADYGGTEHVTLKSAQEALEKAKKFVQAIKDYMDKNNFL